MMDAVNTGLFQSMVLVAQKRAIPIMNFSTCVVTGAFQNKQCEKNMRMD